MAAAIRRIRDQRGMTTAEYAVGTVAACAFAGLMLQIVADWQTLLPQILAHVTDAFSGPMMRVPR
jgi:Protein of unknown function (DUF4244)